MSMSKPWAAYAAMTLSMMTVGSSVVAGKLLVQSVPVFVASALRFGIAAALLIALWFILDGKKPVWVKSEVYRMLLMSFCGSFLFSVCLLYGLQYTGAAESGVMTSTTPVFVALLSALLLKERLTPPVMLGVAAAVLGVAVLHIGEPVGTETGTGTGAAWTGNLLILLAVASEALFAVIGKGLTGKYSPVLLSAISCTLGFLWFLPLAVYDVVRMEGLHLTAGEWSYIVYYAVVVTVLGYILWYAGMKKVPGSVSGLFTAVIPVTSIVLSFFILQEQVTWRHGIGVLLVVAGIFGYALFASGTRKEWQSSRSSYAAKKV
ncbi:DMT family transporter [Paenibacillus elgii]|uniref:DMT family transporter n=1 Tax=Paenibacillus elgii TaxID=189691 RepID=UPI000248CCD1|nr:DMT family transporter [Paenibacillus elgii]